MTPAKETPPANQVAFRPEIVRRTLRMLRRSPWLVPRLLRIPSALRALTDPRTFLETHREVQGERLLGPSSRGIAGAT